jgi:hypothetical protein
MDIWPAFTSSVGSVGFFEKSLVLSRNSRADIRFHLDCYGSVLISFMMSFIV